MLAALLFSNSTALLTVTHCRPIEDMYDSTLCTFHGRTCLAIEGIIEREEKQQPEPPPKYIQKAQTTTENT